MCDNPNHKKVTITSIVYIPTQDGYWSESFEVLKLFFQSLLENTHVPFDLMVLDNGSCVEVQDYLINMQRKEIIQYLILSEINLRKTGALSFLLSIAPGEYISYADSDVYFLPGWLDESLRVLEAFPEAGRVTALPMCGGDQTKNQPHAFRTVQHDSSITSEIGILVPEKFLNTHRSSIGIQAERYQDPSERKDVHISRGVIKAYLSGADFQFTITREALQKILPIYLSEIPSIITIDTSRNLQSDPIYTPILEERLLQANLWMLSTADYLVHHMGNSLPDLHTELDWLDFSLTSPYIKRQTELHHSMSPIMKRFVRSRRIRRLLHNIHTYSYKLLYE